MSEIGFLYDSNLLHRLRQRDGRLALFHKIMQEQQVARLALSVSYGDVLSAAVRSATGIPQSGVNASGVTGNGNDVHAQLP